MAYSKEMDQSQNQESPIVPIERTSAGLRDHLFAVLEDMRAGKISAIDAKAVAAVAQTIIKSAEVQLEFEKARLADEIPAHLGQMRLTPPLDVKK
jgi:hypothetical protein